MRSALTFLILALIAGAAGFAAYQWLQHEHPPLIGQAAPPLAFTDTEDQTHTLSQMQGQWVLINFWASWCAPCMDELPLLVEAQSQYAARGLRILGPALDSEEAIAPVVTRFGINYPVMADFAGADVAMQALGNERGALPYTVLIDPQGKIAEVVLGGMSRDVLNQKILAHLQ
ncbi:TlpA disulfide reductase family protein [Sinimarinibacterium sp. NLF-5-8]|uniref:TlpA family protein disulfide reductase n=1 Tax=Sinimarinibacterium sp. NLF-5-8 TaxID=2698684 RepID=UPI00137B95EC|nr:TlpA disulfide reductase family protein [Sinimarinibacterium sp. NLF-5-8]QHS08794.1 TlpA family protein disulfide reductase [Sinimarinibacterium sp. NLF-5-8]